MPRLTVFRGLPGSGKSTAASGLGCLVISAQDMYSVRGGKYSWSRARQDDAIAWADRVFGLCLDAGVDVCVAETLVRRECVERYAGPARRAGYDVVVHDLAITVEESLARNAHSVIPEDIHRMAEAWEPWLQQTRSRV